jgi:hypothetical protein
MPYVNSVPLCKTLHLCYKCKIFCAVSDRFGCVWALKIAIYLTLWDTTLIEKYKEAKFLLSTHCIYIINLNQCLLACSLRKHYIQYFADRVSLCITIT